MLFRSWISLCARPGRTVDQLDSLATQTQCYSDEKGSILPVMTGHRRLHHHHLAAARDPLDLRHVPPLLLGQIHRGHEQIRHATDLFGVSVVHGPIVETRGDVFVPGDDVQDRSLFLHPKADVTQVRQGDREDAVNGLLIGKAGGIRLRIDSNMEAMLLHLQGDGISVSEAVASGEVNVLAAGRLLGAMETLFEKGFITLSGKAVRDPDEG